MSLLRRSLLILGLALAACTHAQPERSAEATSEAPSEAHLPTFSAQLRGEQEVPPATTLGQGQLDAVLDSRTRQLRWKLQHAHLSGPVQAAHFHGPAPPGTNAPVVLPLGPRLDSPLEGRAQLSEAQVADLVAGRWYVNLHTAAFPAGELRGQLVQR